MELWSGCAKLWIYFVVVDIFNFQQRTHENVGAVDSCVAVLFGFGGSRSRVSPIRSTVILAVD